ncbi:MAG TPA: TerC family protein [Verrucomicrobiae bacterium]|nr:TerC family protein [Verrucomicrobiae bacterium]
MHPASFLIGALTNVVIDLLLAGDNALIIAMAVRRLPPPQRRVASAVGAGGAVVMRVALTFAASQLLNVQFLKLAGGLFVLWIAIKVLLDASEPPESKAAPDHMLKAIWYVMFADLTMSVDNILAIAGASHGSLALIIFGLAVSIPFVIFSSNLLATLMNRYPALIFIGSGILGKVAADMMLTDPFVERTFRLSSTVHFVTDAALALGLVAAGFLLCRKRPKTE